MIQSLVKIEFVPVTGPAITLLDYGDGMTDFPKFPLSQKDASYTAAGAKWARGRPMGGAEHAGSWSRRVLHPTHQAAEFYCLTHPASMPINVFGKLRVSVKEAGIVEYKDARILACTPGRLTKTKYGLHPTITEYRANMGEMVVVDAGIYTPPAIVPVDPPGLVPPYVETPPGRPPTVLPPYGRIVGVEVSGITYPTIFNGVYPLLDPEGLPEDQNPIYQNTVATVESESKAFPWKIQQWPPAEYAGDFFRATTVTENPWDAVAWEAMGDATGTPVVRPIYG